jgi:hypothetical protein
MISLPKDYVSVTQIEMYLRCARQYEFRYLQNITSPPGVALIEGSSCHVALEHNNGQKIESHKDLEAKEVAECFADTFSEKSKEIEDWESETKDKVIDRGTKLLNKYMGDISPVIQPLAVEKEFRANLIIDEEPVEVLGYVDVEQEGILSDYKVVGRVKSQGDTDNSLQLATYGVATGTPEAEFICLCKTKTPKIERVKTLLNDKTSQWAAEVIAGVVRAISLGAFPPCDPTHWCCSERFCGYWHLCRGKKG